MRTRFLRCEDTSFRLARNRSRQVPESGRAGPPVDSPRTAGPLEAETGGAHTEEKHAGDQSRRACVAVQVYVCTMYSCLVVFTFFMGT